MEEEFAKVTKVKDNGERTKIRTRKNPDYDRIGIGKHN